MMHIFRQFNGWDDREKRLVFDAGGEKPAATPPQPEANETPKENDPAKLKQQKLDRIKQVRDALNNKDKNNQENRNKVNGGKDADPAANEPDPFKDQLEKILNASPENKQFVEVLLKEVEQSIERAELDIPDFLNGLKAMIALGPQFALNYMSTPPEQRDAPESQADKAKFEAVYNKLDTGGKKAFEKVAQIIQGQGVKEEKKNPGKNGREVAPEVQMKLKESAENALPKPAEAKNMSNSDLNRRIASAMMNFGVSVMVNAETKELTVTPPTSGWDKMFNTFAGAGMYVLSYYLDAKQKLGGLFNKEAAAPAPTPTTTPDAKNPEKPNNAPPESNPEVPSELEKEVKDKGLKVVRADAELKQKDATTELDITRGETSNEEQKLVKHKTDLDAAKAKLNASPKDKEHEDENKKLDEAVKSAERTVQEQETKLNEAKKKLADAEAASKLANEKLQSINTLDKSSSERAKKMNEEINTTNEALRKDPLNSNKQAQKLRDALRVASVTYDDKLTFTLNGNIDFLINVGREFNIDRTVFELDGSVSKVEKAIAAIKSMKKTIDERVALNDAKKKEFEAKGLTAEEAVKLVDLNIAFDAGLDFVDKKYTFTPGKEKQAYVMMEDADISNKITEDITNQLNAAMKPLSVKDAMQLVGGDKDFGTADYKAVAELTEKFPDVRVQIDLLANDIGNDMFTLSVDKEDKQKEMKTYVESVPSLKMYFRVK